MAALTTLRNKNKIVLKQESMPGFVSSDLVFELTMYVSSFADFPFISSDNRSSCLWMAKNDDGAMLMMSFELWRFVKHQSHSGAYGEYGVGYVILDVDNCPMTVLKKIAIDVESVHGYWWDGKLGFFDSVQSPFVVPYGTRVNVGEYTLDPYGTRDEYGFDKGEKFTKWRTQMSSEFFGVHCLQHKDTVFAMIPSVVIQLSCPEGATRHLESAREPNEAKWAEHLVQVLRDRGLHARDVHSEHHGVVIMNKTPSEFVSALADGSISDIVARFGMEHWVESYAATFGKSKLLTE